MSLCFLLFLLLLSSPSFVQAQCEVTIHYVGLQTEQRWAPWNRKLKGSSKFKGSKSSKGGPKKSFKGSKASKGGSKKSSKEGQSGIANADGPIEVWSYNGLDLLCWSAFDRGTVALGSSRTFQCGGSQNFCQFNFGFPVSATTLQSGTSSCLGEESMTLTRCVPPRNWPHQAKGRCGRSYIVYFRENEISCFCRTINGRTCVG